MQSEMRSIHRIGDGAREEMKTLPNNRNLLAENLIFMHEPEFHTYSYDSQRA